MNVEHLKLFVRLAATHNISQAGQELGLSPAVASSYISKLESALGVRLVHRTTRKVSLTEEGVAFLPHAEEVLESIEIARASVGAGNRLPSGVLRVSAPASFGRMHLIPAMQAFMDAHPGLKIDCRLSDSIIDLVEGGFDVAIRNAALKDSTLVARKLTSDTRIVCASPSYLIKHGKPTHPTELLEHDFVCLTGFENWTFETPDGPVSVKPKGEFKADNGEAVRDACVHGLGITVSSAWCCYEYLERGELIPILEDYPLISETAIWAVYPSSRLLAPKVRAFIDFFSDYFGSQPYWELEKR
ncbi:MULTISPECIES: LysR family transcriptional regulator [Vibrio]|uniref:LysR family transcriptional regulator n=1 Tax=Vibrio mediterranei TaxID=689 RepID=A0A3G4VHA3_9VIBR|nr:MULTISPECIES: LysR family transcriptional regulator [Vibrio]AYV24207.1 LysR family transcriptional regulator [Vibrio mediterranei]MDA0106729.1 LysR family transcriptional regulator [Vibrio sp. La 4.2.2]